MRITNYPPAFTSRGLLGAFGTVGGGRRGGQVNTIVVLLTTTYLGNCTRRSSAGISSSSGRRNGHGIVLGTTDTGNPHRVSVNLPNNSIGMLRGNLPIMCGSGPRGMGAR